mmetsp:Transcript_40837/g.89330  ORF Transcript_40837/g.89330 Transcript_40837/m.89330 type:complete len:491 (+) Transcript_40837:92-1564(+)|eukprot:CAMPEP_0170617282 /NCGR_PEP_ID=MMETSP0224-20130122/26332_1 /TAXON_ID=285029 /ORGANISM="Togula jolla, Strain CCCM 725" /LENGTH=490 /DNA_ID=CAMNT_0010943159 /DNA_START=60 /DNA_END=1529 /DNA_ORIENTATION=+
MTDGGFPGRAKPGEGEDSMHTFTLQHVTSIIHPLAEHVREMQDSTQLLMKKLTKVVEQLDRNCAVTDTHERQLAALSGEVAQMRIQVDIAHLELPKLHQRDTSLKVDIDAMRNDMRKLDSRSLSSAASLHELQPTVANNVARIRQLEDSLNETSTLSKQVSNNLSRLRDYHDGLNDRHLGLAKDIQNAQRVGEEAREAHKKNQSMSETHQKEVEESLSLLERRTKHIEVLLSELDGVVHAEAKNRMQTSSQVEKMADSMSLALSQPALDGRQESGKMEATLKKVGQLELDLLKLSQSLDGGSQNPGRAQIEGLSKTVLSHGSDLQRFGREIQDLASVQRHHSDNLQKLDELTEKQGSEYQKLKEQAEIADLEIEGLKNFSRLTSGKLEGHAREIDKVHTHIAHATEGLGAAKEGLRGLTGELGNSKEQLANVGARLDLAHEFIQGLGKGLSGAHGMVIAGSGGMLPPKTGRRNLLPVMPGYGPKAAGASS